MNEFEMADIGAEFELSTVQPINRKRHDKFVKLLCFWSDLDEIWKKNLEWVWNNYGFLFD